MNVMKSRANRIWLCCSLMCSVLIRVAGAAGTNAIPVTESFENCNDGHVITNSPGWSLGEGAGTLTGRITTDPDVVDALTNYTSGGGTFPLSTTHDKVLALGGPVSLSVSGAAGGVVECDFMLLPVLREQPPAFDGSHCAGLVFNTNAQVEIFHRNTTGSTNEWITLTNGPTITTGDWVRITFEQDYSHHMYRVRIDESQPIADARGWDGPGGSQPGSWFHMPATNGQMSSITFHGYGKAYLDDLVIGDGQPVITTVSVTDLFEGTGDLNGHLVTTGFSATAVEVYWGTVNGGTDTGLWTDVGTLAAPQLPGSVTVSVSGIEANITNFYRFAAVNDTGRHWADETGTFILEQSGIPSYAETNAVPFVESFETYNEGADIDDAVGWYIRAEPWENAGVVTTNSKVVNALTDYTDAGGALPLDTTHDKVLSLEGFVALSVTSSVAEPVRTDFMLMPRMAARRPDFDASYQAGLIFNTDGQAEIFHHNAGSTGHEWITLTNGPTITSGDWVRVTFHQDYTNHMYQVCLNGAPPIADSHGYDTPGGAQPGSWFRMPNDKAYMSSLSFEGEGEAYLDDVVVGGLLPRVDTLPVTNVAAASANLGGFLSHTGFSPTAVLVYWGASDGGTTTTAWAATNTLAAPQVPGILSSHVSGLTTSSLYFFRYAASNTSGMRWADATETFLVGEVTVSSTDQAALESPPESGNVVFSRPVGTTSGVLEVQYELGGSAGNGVDYQHLSGTATIPEGETNVTVAVMPLRDALVEGEELVQVSLLPGGYVVGSSHTTTVSIEDVTAGSLTLVWDNGSGDHNWNDSSTNWLPGVLFVDTDPVEFLGAGTGRIYVGDAVYTGSVFESKSPGGVFPASIVVSNGTYEFEGGHVAGGPTLVAANGRLIDRNLQYDSFGNGPVTLDGGELWRQIPPGAVTRTHYFTNDILVNAESLLHGQRGDNFWGGNLELRDRLNLNVDSWESYLLVHSFSGTLTVNQDTNYPNDRVLCVQGHDGATHVTGPIMDSTNATHTGSFPLVIGSRRDSDLVAAGEIYLEGFNTYSNGTVIAYWDTRGNHERGVTVQPGSSLGEGPVIVQGTNNPTRIGAVLTLNAEDAIDDETTLSLYGGGMLVLPNTGQVEKVKALYVDGTDAGWGFFGAADLPWNISGPGRVFVSSPWAESTILIVR